MARQLVGGRAAKNGLASSIRVTVSLTALREDETSTGQASGEGCSREGWE